MTRIKTVQCEAVSSLLSSIRDDAPRSHDLRRVLTYGTFDLLHYVHNWFLRQVKRLSDYLIVALSTDQLNVVKGKKSFYPYEI